MDKDIKPATSVASFDYELYEGDPDHLRTVVATPALPGPYIDPVSLKLKHRIGRGYFGDVWLATHHQTGADFDEYHEVAVKMLYPISEDHVKHFTSKFEEVWRNLKSKQVQGVCWLHGMSVISGKLCIAMKFYEGSIGDQIARLKGGKLPLSDVLRYGIELAKGIQEMHSMDILVLNLKPTNFLLNERDQAFLGDFGIPYLLLGFKLPDSDLAFRLGTPNYMAPEQWQPEVRGPISYETDAWGFGCSIVEMLTGVQPWFGKSVEEIFQSVVINQEKPQLPSGLPPALESVLSGCFEYDLRNRPLMLDILQAFESSKNAVYSEGEWIGPASTLLVEKPNSSGYTTWFLSKDHLQVGDTVRSRKGCNSCKPQNMAVMEGSIVGLEKDTDRDGFVLVRLPTLGSPLRVSVSTLERVTDGLAAGDWVRLNKENKKHSAVGILHSIQRDGIATVGFLGLETLWKGRASELQMAEPLSVGQFVRLRESVLAPRFDWPQKGGGAWATGKISQILPNGCLLVGFPGRFVLGNKPNIFLADPDEVEVVSFDTCPGLLEKYQHVEDFHWAVRPLAITFSLFMTVKLGIFVGKNISAKLKKSTKKKQIPSDGRPQDAVGGGNSPWLPPPVANILFKDGTVAARNFKNKGKAVEHESDKNEEEEDGFSGIAAAPVTCMTIQKRQTYKRCEEFSGEQWRKEKMNRAERLEKQLKTRWAVEEVIEEQLNRFHAQYNQAMIPTKLKDIAHLLTPKWAPPQELAALSWYGDWRPSTIPVLLHSLINSSSSFSTSLAADSDWVKTVMKQLINELRVEEAVIDEEMAEIQANCIFHLPFGITKKKKKNKKDGDALACVYTEFRKVHQVLTKAQNLRLKAMDMAVKKVLSPTDAAEFLVAFAKIQDLIHQHAMNMKLTNGPISVPTK